MASRTARASIREAREVRVVRVAECVMKKSVRNTKSESSHVASEVVEPSSMEVAGVVTPAPAAVAPAPAATVSAPVVITTMADAAVQECNALLGQVLAKVGSQSPLNADQIRKGGAEVIPKILALCQQQGITQVGPLTVQEMSDQQKRGDALAEVGLRSALVQKKLRDSAMGAHGRSWQIATTMYTLLQRMAVDDPELALGLQPVEEFFQTKVTKGKVRENKKVSKAKKAATRAAVGASAGEGTAADTSVEPPTPTESNGVNPPAAPPASPPAANGGAH
jgi:hypothetical protein